MSIILNIVNSELPRTLKADLTTFFLSDYFSSVLIKEERYRKLWYGQVNSTQIYFIRVDLTNSNLYSNTADKNYSLKNHFTLSVNGEAGLLHSMILKAGKESLFWVFTPKVDAYVSRSNFGLKISKYSSLDITSSVITDTVNDLFAINSSEDGNSTLLSLNNLEIQAI